MKKILYILLILPLIVGCKEKKTKKAVTTYTPEISVTKPVVKDVALTKDYPGYLTSEQTVNLVARVNGTLESASYVPGARVKKGDRKSVV